MKDETAQALVRRCPVGLSLHGQRGAFRAASDECAQLFGRPVAALLAASLPDLVDPRDVERVRDAWDIAALRGEDATLRYRLALPGHAEEIWMETQLRSEPGPADDDAQIACASRRLRETTPGEVEQDERAALELARGHRDILVDLLPALVWYGPVSPDLKSYRTSYFNEYLFAVTGYRPENWFQTPGFWRQCVHPDDLQPALEAHDQMLRGERRQGPPYRFRAKSGKYLWLQSSVHVERDAAGVPLRMHGLTLDITTYIAAREENADLQREITAKASRILELSAPIIPMGAGVLLMPLIGMIDVDRADHVLEVLLDTVQRLRARRVILDLTGVSAVEPDGIAVLVRAAAAVRMFGARSMLTGIRPDVALTIIELGVSLTGLKVHRTLQDALGAV